MELRNCDICPLAQFKNITLNKQKHFLFQEWSLKSRLDATSLLQIHLNILSEMSYLSDPGY